MHYNKHKIIYRMTAMITAAVLTAGIFAGCSTSQDNEANSSTVTEISETVSDSITSQQSQEPVDDPEDIIPTDFSLTSVITSVTANSTIGSLINTDTDFTLTSTEDMEASKLRSLLSISPEIDFEIERTAPCSYRLTSSEELPENSIAVLRLSDEEGNTAYKWSFQTYGDLTVTECYPADGSESVYPSSGIEITFSAPVTAENAEDYFEIEPNVSGTFRKHRNTLYFVPDNELASNTYYTVTVKSGFCSDEGAELKEDISLTFKTTRGDSKNYIYTSDSSETFVPGDTVCIEYYSSSPLKNDSREYDVKLYKYDNAQDYYNTLRDFAAASKRTENSFSVDGLQIVYEDTLNPVSGSQDYGPSFLLLPDNLEKGYYLADVQTEVGDEIFHIQKHIQISSISVFSTDVGGDTEFFINDAATGKAAENAKVEILAEGREYTAYTNSDGIADIRISSENYTTGMVRITYNNEVFCDLHYYNASVAEDINDLYYTYIYTDREQYLTTDTINVWGVVIPRRNDISLPDDFYLRLERYDDNVMGDDIPVTLDTNGCFTAKIDIKNHIDIWWLYLNLYSGDTLFDEKSITIHDYEKPTYVYDVTAPMYAENPQSEPVELELDVSFYDGTPANNVEFTVEGYEVKDKGSQKLLSDPNGNIKANILFEDRDSWQPYYLWVNFVPTGIQDEYTYAYGKLYGFFRDVMLDYDVDHDAKALTLYTNKIDPTKMEFDDDGYSYFYDYDMLKGDTADTTITAVLKRSWYTQKEVGSYYDYLKKEKVKKYTYLNHDEVVETYTIDTADGIAVLNDLPIGLEDSYYSMELTWTDTQGRTVRETISLTDYSSYYHYTYAKKNYTFDCSSGDLTFKENEELTFTLMCNNTAEKVEGGRILFQVFDREIVSSTIYTTGEFTHKMSADYIPNVGIIGAYFDGQHVYPVNYSHYWNYDSYRFDPEDREILLTVTADKESYLPGETAKLTVEANDINGKAVENAIISLSVVDEAAFAVAEQYADSLAEIYAYISIESPYVYYSYIQHTLETDGMGEMGGGGDEGYIRKEFMDTASFEYKTADENGKVEFSFKLPDNLTTWRATIQGVNETKTDTVYAGTVTYPLVVTQPMFITPVSSSYYLEGDDIAVSAVCFGESDKTEIITVTLSGNDFEETMTVPSGETANFGKLPVGEYKVLFKAENEKGRDAVELPITVAEELLETQITNTFTLSEGIEINPTKWPAKITFFDKQYMEYTDILYNLSSASYDRLDSTIPQYYAMKKLGMITEKEYIEQFSNITDSGLAKLMTNSEGDEELTAMICLAAPELINRSAVLKQMYFAINSESSYHEDVSSAYLALAALGEPVGSEIVEFLENTSLDKDFLDITDAKTGFNHYDCLKLCAGLAALGDYDNALKYYSKFAHSAVITQNNDGKSMMKITGGYSEEQTALALLTASLLELPEADMMARYLAALPKIYDTYSLELMVYLNHFVPKVSGDAEFSYSRGGKTETVRLDHHHGTCIYFTEEQFKNADFTVKSGDIYAIACYTGSPEEYNKKQQLKVTKEISGELKKGSLVTVTITVSGGGGCYTINDVIPSCARYVGNYNYSTNVIRLYASHVTGKASVSYNMRIVTDGNYIIEGAAAFEHGGVWGQCERKTIEVKGNESDI